jgi:hypothetical protein
VEDAVGLDAIVVRHRATAGPLLASMAVLALSVGLSRSSSACRAVLPSAKAGPLPLDVDLDPGKHASLVFLLVLLFKRQPVTLTIDARAAGGVRAATCSQGSCCCTAGERRAERGESR